jgi:hypothetical protein
VSLGDDIAAVLPELRAQAESRMRDTCVITASAAGTWDDATGTYTDPTETTVYEGKCRVRQPSPTGGQVDSGTAVWTVDHAVVSLPIDGTDMIGPGHFVTITASAEEPARVGWVLTVEAGHYQTDSTARRLPCRVVSRDG